MGILQKYHVSCYFTYEKQVSKHNIKSSEYFLMLFLYTNPLYICTYCTHKISYLYISIYRIILNLINLRGYEGFIHAGDAFLKQKTLLF